MSLPWLIYWAETFGSFGVFLRILSFVLGGIALATVLASVELSDPEKWRRKALNLFLTSVGCAALTIFVPSQKTIHMMAAAHFGAEAATSPEMQKLRKLVNDQLDEMLEDE